jgi:hypothetical protein
MTLGFNLIRIEIPGNFLGLGPGPGEKSVTSAARGAASINEGLRSQCQQDFPQGWIWIWIFKGSFRPRMYVYLGMSVLLYV